MAKHHPDLIMCRKQPGISIGRLCERCDGMLLCGSRFFWAVPLLGRLCSRMSDRSHHTLSLLPLTQANVSCAIRMCDLLR